MRRLARAAAKLFGTGLRRTKESKGDASSDASYRLLLDAREERRSIALQLSQSEERYQTFIAGLPHMVWIATKTGAVTYFSAHWAAYTGLAMEPMLGWAWESIVHPDDTPSLMRTYGEALSQGTPFSAEYRIKGADGTYRWFIGRALPIRAEDGTIVQWFGTSTDIDDRIRSLQMQHRLTAQLQSVVEATNKLSISPDTPALLATLCDLIVPRFADWMALNVVEPDGRIRNVALSHADPTKASAAAVLRGSYYIDPAYRGAIVNVIETQQPFLSSNYSATVNDLLPAYPDKRSALEELGLTSVICVPIIVDRSVFGVLSTIWSQSDRRYSEAEVPFFEELAKRLAVAFDGAARLNAAHVNEEISRRMMQSSEDCIAVLSLDASLVTVNDQGAAKFLAAGTGLKAGSDWIACWRPDQRQAAAGALQAARAGETGTYQGCLRDDGAAPEWWDVVVTPITNVDGTPTQLLAMCRNITRHKGHESELEAIAARYRAFANAIPAIAFTATANGQLDFVNDRWMEYTGLSYHLSLGQGLISVTHPGERPTLTADWFSTIEDGRGREAETRLKRAADGTYRWHLMRAVPIRAADGQVVQWFGTGTDIDDQKRAEAALAEARDVALNAATMKSQFVSTMSHEIRTPISGVIGMTELLLVTQLSDEQREYANVVRDSGQSLLRVINDILDYSKLDAGKLQLEALDFSVESQLKSVTDLLGAEAAAKNIALSVRIEPHVPYALAGDPGRLRQILVNLIGNAIKFTPAGGRVEVAVIRLVTDADTVRVRFEVKDNGVGIEHEAQGRLFQAFSQGDGSTTRKYGGTGLGLSICKQLVSLMKGTIGLESEPGNGATFWFTIDFNRTGPARTTRLPVPAERERRREAIVQRAKILLVEDNHVNTLLALRQFRQLGLTIATAANGREALEAVEASSFDVIFMDCHMPEMDGFEATREIRRLEQSSGRHQPIVAMTANAQVEDRNACIAAGMDDYLSKPSSLAQIQTVLDRWLLE